MAGLTKAEMLTDLQFRLNDSSTNPRFSDTIKYRAINDAQLELFEFLPSSELSELENSKLGISTDGAGVTQFSNFTRLAKQNDTLFTPNALRFLSGGYVKSDNTEKHWFNSSLKKTDAWKTENNLLFGNSVKNPVIIDTGTNFEIYPAQETGFNIDIDGYLRCPPNVGSSQDSIFKPTMHFLIVILAELILKNKHDQLIPTMQKYTQDLGITAEGK